VSLEERFYALSPSVTHPAEEFQPGRHPSLSATTSAHLAFYDSTHTHRVEYLKV
jgi:hypothetical protein